MNRTVLDFWVGIFVVIGIVSVLFLSLKVGNLSFASLANTYQLQFEFDNIGGLKVRGPVKAGGVVVGRIADIHYDIDRFRAVVKVDIDDRYRFPKDTLISIFTSGLLGEQFINLDPGGDETVWKTGETVTKTQSAVVIERLISQFLFDKASEGGGDSQEGK